MWMPWRMTSQSKFCGIAYDSTLVTMHDSPSAVTLPASMG